MKRNTSLCLDIDELCPTKVTFFGIYFLFNPAFWAKAQNAGIVTFHEANLA